jgi:integrase
VVELLDAWSERRPRKGEIAERTMLGCRSLIEHKINPALGGLRLSRVEQAKHALACGVSLSADAYVFSHEADGSRPIRPGGVTQRFTALARRLGVQCRLHDLRHFLVTQLISAGVDVRTVSGRVGHRDGGPTTLGSYAHFQAAQDRTAAELMEGLIRLPRATGDG